MNRTEDILIEAIDIRAAQRRAAASVRYQRVRVVLRDEPGVSAGVGHIVVMGDRGPRLVVVESRPSR